MFATPTEVAFIQDEWCGNVLWFAYEAKATYCQLKAISRMLSFAFQLRFGVKGNWGSVKKRWDNDLLPDKMGPPTQQQIAKVCLPASMSKVAFTTAWTKETSWSYPRWCVGYMLDWDWIVIGSRCKEDLKRIKYSRNHGISKTSGWMWTQFLGGRCKVEAKLGVRPWKAWRTCMCIGGEHKGLPNDFRECYQLFGKDGNPKVEPTWTTQCPLTCWEVITHWLKRSMVENNRVYPKWNPRTCRFGKEDIGRDRMHTEMTAWLNVQKANPEGLALNTNSGRKSFAKICEAVDMPYRENFEYQADQWKNWVKYYQPSCEKDLTFTRRDQSEDPEVCCRGHVRMRNAWARGKPAPPSPPAQPAPPTQPPPSGIPAGFDFVRLQRTLELNIRLMGGGAELMALTKS